MTLHYRPKVVEASSSVTHFTNEVSFGWLVRSIHRASSGLMVLVLLLHSSFISAKGHVRDHKDDHAECDQTVEASSKMFIQQYQSKAAAAAAAARKVTEQPKSPPKSHANSQFCKVHMHKAIAVKAATNLTCAVLRPALSLQA
eukprot:1063241-Amphidinium_carterae.2